MARAVLRREWERWKRAIGNPDLTPLLWTMLAVLAAWVPIALAWHLWRG